VEVGPGTVLTGLGKKQARDARFASFEAPEQLAEVEAMVRA
jgi:malonyl CoA-acyl carrier protein transacylase